MSSLVVCVLGVLIYELYFVRVLGVLIYELYFACVLGVLIYELYFGGNRNSASELNHSHGLLQFFIFRIL